jgi:hypothetical protein
MCAQKQCRTLFGRYGSHRFARTALANYHRTLAHNAFDTAFAHLFDTGWG